MAQWCNPLTLQQEQSGGVGLIPGTASPLEHHEKGSQTWLALNYFCNPVIVRCMITISNNDKAAHSLIPHSWLIRAFWGPGTNLQCEAPCESSEQKIFRSCLLDWFRMHLRALPAVKISKIINYEASRGLGKLPHLPPSWWPWPHSMICKVTKESQQQQHAQYVLLQQVPIVVHSCILQHSVSSVSIYSMVTM